MDEDDDDLYDPADSLPNNSDQHGNGLGIPEQDDIYGDEEEDEDDDDEFNIITEAPLDAAPPEVPHPRHVTLRNEPLRSASIDSTPVTKTPISSVAVKLESASPAIAGAKPTTSLKPGSAYPAIHASTIDVNANPTHPATGKPLLSTDFDSDFLAEDEKPWRRPHTDLTDYFNYGFDEFTWASYCLKQQEVRKEVTDQKKQLEDMQAFLTMGGLPALPGGPAAAPTQSVPAPTSGGGGAGAIPGLPGMPDFSAELMQGMLSSMIAQGLDPSAMDPMAFMQHAQSMMGGGQGGPGGGQQTSQGFAGPPQGHGYGGQGSNQQQMGYGGYNQHGGYGGRGRGGGGRRW